MAELVDKRRLASYVRAKRGNRGLREAAQEIGTLSAATLSRVEQGNMPDLDTFLRLCQWLDEPPQSFMTVAARVHGEYRGSRPTRTPDLIAAQLRADPTLSARAADALSMTIELAYQAAMRDETDEIQA